MSEPMTTTTNSVPKAALITGGSRGIGAACARLFARQGYGVGIVCRKAKDRAEALAEELAALGVGEPTHTFLQAGVGSMAGGVAAYLAETCKNPPAMAVVEAWESACVLESIRQGRLVTIEGHTQTSMAGLNCGTPNPQVMPILQEWAQFYIRCQDEVTFRAMRRLAHPGPHETAVISGESGASGLGAFLAVMDNPEYRKTMGFDETSVILLFSTEGDTDPDHYKAVVAD